MVVEKRSARARIWRGEVVRVERERGSMVVDDACRGGFFVCVRGWIGKSKGTGGQ